MQALTMLVALESVNQVPYHKRYGTMIHYASVIAAGGWLFYKLFM